MEEQNTKKGVCSHFQDGECEGGEQGGPAAPVQRVQVQHQPCRQHAKAFACTLRRTAGKV